MATIRMWALDGNIQRPIDYICDEKKVAEGCVVSSMNIDPGATGLFWQAIHQFQNEEDKPYDPSEINGYHLQMSFAPGEVSEDECLDLAKQWIAAQYTAGTPVTICYKLATPEPFQATGNQSLPALPGTNTVYTDADAVRVEGRAVSSGGVPITTSEMNEMLDEILPLPQAGGMEQALNLLGVQTRLSDTDTIAPDSQTMAQALRALGVHVETEGGE